MKNGIESLNFDNEGGADRVAQTPESQPEVSWRNRWVDGKGVSKFTPKKYNSHPKQMLLVELVVKREKMKGF